MKKALTIIRVSEEDQLRGYGPDVQAGDVETHLPQAGLVEIGRRVVQEESTTWDRPKFESVLNEAISMRRRGELEAVVFPRRNRLARFGSAGAYYLGLLDREGLEIHFAREQRRYDPRDPESFDWVMRGLSQAQTDADEIRANTSWARRLRAEQDHMMPTGRSKCAYDYHPYRKDWGRVRHANSGRYTVNPDGAAWVRRWADWLLVEGISIRKLSKVMKNEYGMKIARSTIADILTDPILVGKVYAYRTKVVVDVAGKRRTVSVPEDEWLLVYEDQGLRILTDEQFYALRERFKRNRENSSRHNTRNWYPPLRSLVFCPCGRRMVGITLGGGQQGQPYYRCLECRRYIKALPLWAEIRTRLKAMLLEPERLVPAIKAQLDSGQSIAHLETELNAKRQRWDMLDQAEEKALRLHLYLPNYPAAKLEAEVQRIGEQRRQLAKEMTMLERQVSELRQAMVDERGLRHFCEIAARNLETMSDEEWRILLETMRLKVVVDDPGVIVKVAVPAVTDEQSVIVVGTSQSSGR